jgi:hypothetical protein
MDAAAPPMGRFSATSMNTNRQAALTKLISLAMANPSKLDKISDFLAKK